MDKKLTMAWMQTRINRKLLIIKKLQKLTLIDMVKKASILYFFNGGTFGLLYVHGLGASCRGTSIPFRRGLLGGYGLTGEGMD